MNDFQSGIKSWVKEDRPREKLLSKGKSALTNSELLAILIGSGNRNLSAVALAAQILQYADNKLSVLSNCNIEELCRFKGIGEAKAISILAAMELSQRRQQEYAETIQTIQCSEDAYSYCKMHLDHLNHEEFWVLFLNRANHIIKLERVSSGGISGTVVDQRIIFKRALEHQASSIILLHNHPSGNLNPSTQDKAITHKLVEAGKLMQVQVIDHLIISKNGFFSFADAGDLEF